MRVGRGDARRRDLLAARFAGGDFVVEVEQLLEEVLRGGEAVGLERGGVERGVGVLEGMLAGEFERAVHGAEPALDFGQGVVTDAADVAAVGQ